MLRREPEASVVDSTQDQEFALLQALAATDLPVAKVLRLDDGTVFERPAMVVERRPGSAHRALLRDTDPLGLGEGARLRLAGELADLLQAVHSVDVQDVGLGVGAALADPPSNPAEHELECWLRELDRVQLEPQPALQLTAEWLRQHLPPPPERVTLVHGDFRPANVLVDNGRVEALLDWELAHLGDPVDDLGWYSCSLYAQEHFLADRWAVSDFLRRYDEAGGGTVDAGRLHFWQVMSIFRLAVIALAAVRNFCDGVTDRPTPPAEQVALCALQETGLRS